jgi:hypothetical protein
MNSVFPNEGDATALTLCVMVTKVRSPREVVRQNVNRDRRQKQAKAEPEQR